MSQSKLFNISNAIALAIGFFVDLIAIHELLNKTNTIEADGNSGLSAIFFVSSVYLLIFSGIGTRRFFHSRAESSSSKFLNQKAFNEIEKVTSLTQYLLAIPCGILFAIILPWDEILGFWLYEHPLGSLFWSASDAFIQFSLLLLFLYVIVEISRYSSRTFYLSLTPSYRVRVPRKSLDLSPATVMRERQQRRQDSQLRSWETQEDDNLNT
ncbi:MAG: hypothetical protein KME14_18410 [Tildeniella torsiva UHER 1998/13D]|jgi:hypothetical protein|nr:hypothetical protein [Tildeniella torsiva UHER 1998/13D]